jgi:hypothetical protein
LAKVWPPSLSSLGALPSAFEYFWIWFRRVTGKNSLPPTYSTTNTSTLTGFMPKSSS